MNELEIRKIAKEEFISNVMNNLDSTLIFTYIQNLEQKANTLQSKIDKANEILDKDTNVENIYFELRDLFKGDDK